MGSGDEVFPEADVTVPIAGVLSVLFIGLGISAVGEDARTPTVGGLEEFTTRGFDEVDFGGMGDSVGTIGVDAKEGVTLVIKDLVVGVRENGEGDGFLVGSGNAKAERGVKVGGKLSVR